MFGSARYAAPVPEVAAHDLPPVGVRPVLAAAFRTYRRRFGVIVGAALVVFSISALVDVLTDVLADEFADKPALIALLLTVAGVAVLGTEFFAGLTDRIAGQEERGHPRQPLGQILRTLPYGRLIVADVVLAGGTFLLSFALLVPGMIFFTFHALVGPALVMEDRKAAARSVARASSSAGTSGLCSSSSPCRSSSRRTSYTGSSRSSRVSVRSRCSSSTRWQARPSG